MGHEFDEGGDAGAGSAPAAVAFEGYAAGRRAFAAGDQDLVHDGLVPDCSDLLKSLQAAQAEPLKPTDVIAQATDQVRCGDAVSPVAGGTEIAKHAEALGELHPDWWRNEGKNGEIRKCNTFADRVYRDMDVPLPWDGQHIPTVHGMK